MSRRTTQFLKTALSALHYSGADALAAPYFGGRGVILMLHHVVPEAPRAFEPNGILKVTPDFLETAIQEVRAAGFESIALDDVADRLRSDANRKPFAVFTLDDGYRDNRDFAYPIFKRLGVPFAIYVPSAYADGQGELWWLALEEALRQLDQAELDVDGAGDIERLSLVSDEDKNAAFDAIYWRLRRMRESDARNVVRNLCRKAGFEPVELCRELVMDWDEIRALAKDPLVTIGAHTCNHMALAKLPAEDARREMAESIRRVSAELGKPCRHFSYPYGDAGSAGQREFEMALDLGVSTAVTTRKGLLHKSHAGELTALPRLSLNGDYQEARYIRALLSGVPFALRDGVMRVLGPISSALRAG